MTDLTSAHDSDLRLIAATVHELKTPLTLIHGMSSMLETETFGELNFKQREQIRHIAKASQRLGFLVESLLHVENLPYTKQMQPVQLQSELTHVINTFSEKAAERDITIEYHARRIPPVLADPRSVHQALAHMLGLSVKYAPEGSTVVVKVGKRGSNGQVKISDRSAGIASKEARAIHDSFGRKRQPVKAHSDSSGLSLFIIQSIVDYYGGSLKATTSSSGSSITMELPLSNQLPLF